MEKYQVKTTPINDSGKKITFSLKQEHDAFNILSLTLNQKDEYPKMGSEYGVIVGRCYMNNGVGIPNVKVSLFIPISDEDKLDKRIFEMYPYTKVTDKNNDSLRYNLLRESGTMDDCFVSVGSFPDKSAVLDNPELMELYTDYYCFTTTSNHAGDYMFTAIPVGQYNIVAECDLSDIGIFSQKPYDFIEQGSSSKLFESPNQFKSSENLDSLTQIKTHRSSVYVYPLWGDEEEDIIGISRFDIDLNYTITPKAFFIGAIFSDNEKDSVNKNCIPRKNVGNLCETVERGGRIQMIRKTLEGTIEDFDIDGGDLIDENGNWYYRIPMNLDYMITNEYGDLVPTDDKKRGIPTRTECRFKISVDSAGDNGRLRTTANYLVPHNPTSNEELDYSFGEDTKDFSFATFHWNKIYTVKNFIPRLQRHCNNNNTCIKRRTITGIKDVDGCVGTKNPFPYNKFNGRMNPLFSVICMIISVIVSIIVSINWVLSGLRRVPLLGKKVRCIDMGCEDNRYAPGCSNNKAKPSGCCTSTKKTNTMECYRDVLAEQLKIYSFDFYNDWVNGSLYALLLKYKDRKSGAKFCDSDKNLTVYHLNTLYKSESGSVGFKNKEHINIGHGYIKEYNDELFYVPYTPATSKLFATDIYNLGAVNDCDWQGLPKVHTLLTPTSYNIPTALRDDDEDIRPFAASSNYGLLFQYDCDSFDMDERQLTNLTRICEIGVGIDETRDYNGVTKVHDGNISIEEIENKYVRDALIYLNYKSPIQPSLNISSNFDEANYRNYRYLSPTNTSRLGIPLGDSLFFYFGSKAGSNALDQLRIKYLNTCLPKNISEITIIGTVINSSVLSESIGDGTIEVAVSGGTGPYTYEWSSGETTNKIINLKPGNYTVKVIDVTGYFAKKTFTINSPMAVSGLYDVTNSVDIYSSDGAINLFSISGGIGTTNQGVNTIKYNVVVSGAVTRTYTNIGRTGVVIDNLSVGAYTLTISDMDNSGFVSIYPNIIVDGPPALNASVLAEDGVCLNTSDGVIEVDFLSGVSPYYVNVVGLDSANNNFTSDEINNYEVPKGNYKVTVWDSVCVALENTSNPRKNKLVVNVYVGSEDSSTNCTYSVTDTNVLIQTTNSVTYDVALQHYLNVYDSDGSILQYQCELVGDRAAKTLPLNYVSGRYVSITTDKGCETPKILIP